MIPLPVFSQKVFVIASVSAVSLILAGLLFYQVRAQPLSLSTGNSVTKSASSDTVYLSGKAAPASTTVEDPVLEVHIANNGLTLLRGARVLSISAGTIRVGMTWGAADFTWMVQTNYSTKFVNAEGGKETVANIHVGDIVPVTGPIVRSGSLPVVNADVVRK